MMNEWERLSRQAQRYKESYPPGTRIMLMYIIPPFFQYGGMISHETRHIGLFAGNSPFCMVFFICHKEKLSIFNLFSIYLFIILAYRG